MDALVDNDAGEDKTFMAMGVAKTIGTVSLLSVAIRCPSLT